MQQFFRNPLISFREAGGLDRFLRGFGVLVSGGFVFLAWWAPVYQSWKGYPAGEMIYHLLNPFCHQYPTRSLWVWDRPFALCARCFAGYLGVFVSCIFLWPSLSYRKRLLLGTLLLLPGVVDPLVQLLTPYESTNILRLLTGFIGGIGVFLIFYPNKLRREE